MNRSEPQSAEAAIPDSQNLPASFVWLALAILIAERIIFHLFASPIPDEAYYWLWGQHPDWSYYDHPPLQAWLQGVTEAVFGTSRVALRLPSLLTSGVLIWSILWWLKRAQRWGVSIDPKLALLVVFASPLYFIFAAITFHDHLLIALLSLAGVAAFSLFERMSTKAEVAIGPLYATAILLGLAGLTKYNAILFAAGVFGLVVFVPRLRPILKSKHFYLAVLAALICVLPVVYWNAAHQAASFQFHMGDRLQNSRSINRTGVNFAGFLVATSIAVSPFLLIALTRFIMNRPVVTPRECSGFANWRGLTLAVLISSALGCLALSYYISVLYYWGLVAFITFLPFAVLYFAKRWQIMAHVIYGVVFATAFTFNYVVAPINALFDGYDSEFAIMFGWPEVSEKTALARKLRKADFLASSDYRSGALLAFWAQDKDVTVIARRNSQFDFWQQNQLHEGQTAIILTDRAFPMTPYLRDHFDVVDKVETIEIRRFGHFVNSYALYIGHGYKP